VSPIATATSTALDAAIPTIIAKGDVTTASAASAASPGGRARDVPLRLVQEEDLSQQEQRRAAEGQHREAERGAVAGMGDHELVADRDPDQREHDQRQGQRAPPPDGAGVLRPLGDSTCSSRWWESCPTAKT
jgi:hypothetical protein